MCYNSGPLGSFYLSQHNPDKYIASEKAYDEVVGRIDFLTPFVFYILAAIACLPSVILLPSMILSEGSSIPTRWQAVARARGAIVFLVSRSKTTYLKRCLTNYVYS